MSRFTVSRNWCAHIDFDVAEFFGLSISRANASADAASAESANEGARLRRSARSAWTAFATAPTGHHALDCGSTGAWGAVRFFGHRPAVAVLHPGCSGPLYCVRSKSL